MSQEAKEIAQDIRESLRRYLKGVPDDEITNKVLSRIRRDEREACARIADEVACELGRSGDPSGIAKDIAARIRGKVE